MSQGEFPTAGASPTQGVLTEAWEMYKAHWQHLFTIAFAVYVIIGVASWILSMIPVLGIVLAAVVSVVGVFWLQAALVKAVEDVRDGRVDLSLGETFTAVRPYIGTVAIASIVAAIAIAIGFLLLIVPGLYLMTIWVVVIPVIVLEGGTDVFGAFGRSRDLVRGNGMSVFGVIVVTFLILIAFGLVVSLVLSPLPEGAQTFLSDLVGGTVAGPFVALAWTLLYYRLRGSRGTVPGTPPPPPPQPRSP